MEDEKQISPLPKVLGVAGFVLALISIGVGVVAMMKAQTTVEDLNGKIEKAAALSLELKKAGDRIDAVALQVENLKSSDTSKTDALSNQMKTYLEGVGKVLRENRTLIEENRKAIQTLSENFTKVRVPQSSQTTSERSSQTADVPEGNVYVIKSGDNFSKIAKMYGISVSAIQEANPNVDSSRLRIGQKINIPQPK